MAIENHTIWQSNIVDYSLQNGSLANTATYANTTYHFLEDYFIPELDPGTATWGPLDYPLTLNGKDKTPGCYCVQNGSSFSLTFYFPTAAKSVTISCEVHPTSTYISAVVNPSIIDAFDHKFYLSSNGFIQYDTFSVNDNNNKSNIEKWGNNNSWNTIKFKISNGKPIEVNGVHTRKSGKNSTTNLDTYNFSKDRFEEINIKFSCGSINYSNNRQRCGYRNLKVTIEGGPFTYDKVLTPNTTRASISITDNTTIFKAFEFN